MYENPPKINGLVNIERVFLLGEKIKQFLVFQKLQYSNLRSAEVAFFIILSYIYYFIISFFCFVSF